MTSRMTSRVNPKPSRRSDALPTGTVTFVFTDIEGSTRLATELGPATYGHLLEQHHRLLRAAFAAHGGVERGTAGDSFLVVFRDARSAVAAAVEAQRALAGTSWPADAVVRVRMGLHSGEGIAGGDDYVGIDINRAARIAAAGHGGQVLVSDATRALAELDLPAGVSIRDLGRHRLKDLPAPEHLFELVVEGLPSEFPPLRSAEAAPGNLPVRLTSFIGRDVELAELEELLAQNRLLTLTGPGGTGKTSIAVELARRTRERFPDGIWFVALESVTDPELVASAIASTVPLPQPGQRSPEQRLVEDLVDRRMLVVLDNFEQVVDAGALLGRLLRACPELRFLVTSRAVLRVAGEQEFRVPTLLGASAGQNGGRDGEPPSSPAVVLFLDRARSVDPSFSMTEESRRDVEAICARLDGLPLGIELAAARVTLLAPHAILERLEHRLPLPGRATRDVPERQRTLEGAIEWSYELLDEPHRRILARLSVFAGGCRIEEAEAVCGPAEEVGVEVIDGLADLVDQSLVRRDATSEWTRVSMLDTIRDFSRDRLAESGEEGVILRRHRTAYRTLSEEAGRWLTTSRQPAWYGRLAPEVDNIRAAIRHSIDSGEAEDGFRIAAAIWRFWVQRGDVEEATALVSSLLALPPTPADQASRAAALIARGSLRYWMGALTDAVADYEAAWAVARSIGDKRLIFNAVYNLTFPKVVAPEGPQIIREAIDMAMELGDPESLARAAWLRGWLAQTLGDLQQIKTSALEALDLFREIDDVTYMGMCLGTLALMALRSGDPTPGQLREALGWGIESLRMYHAVRDVPGTIVTLGGAARQLAAVAEFPAAVRCDAAARRLGELYRVQVPAQFSRQLGATPAAVAADHGISPGDIDRWVAEGRTMTLAEAAAEALEALERLRDT